MQKLQGGGPRSARGNNFIPNSFRAISSYLKIVSSGASTVATTVRSAASAASSIVDRDDDASHNQVLWAGFDKLEYEGNLRQVLLLGFRSGFQVWDIEEANNVRNLVSKHDGQVTFLQLQTNPISAKRHMDKFYEVRPLLIVCADGSGSGQGGGFHEGLAAPSNGLAIANGHDQGKSDVLPTVVRFYSLKSQAYVHMLKFRSIVYSVRCSSRVVAISQAAQIHCFDAATLERDYTILTNPIVTSSLNSGGIGYGPLAVGPRWLAYSGSPVLVSNSGRVSPQHLIPPVSFSGSVSNGSIVAHYAKESSKQLAVGIVTLGDMGYKKLSRYCSDSGRKVNGTLNGHMPGDSVGMVIVRDIVSKSVIAQFRAHKSPISALCFDPSGTLLVTASVQGHNINVYQIMPASDSASSYIHLFRLQRGLTNAVIQDISFSDDSQWVMISSSRGTSHLFAISPSVATVNVSNQDGNMMATYGITTTKSTVRWPPTSGSQAVNHQNPVTLSVVGRIRSGSNGWRGSVTGMSSLSGAIASSFHNCKGNEVYSDNNNSSLKSNYHLLVFTPSGSVIQYALRTSNGLESSLVGSGLSTALDSGPDGETRMVVEAIQKWNICQKQNRKEREDNFDIYGENGNTESSKVFPEGIEKKSNYVMSAGGIGVSNAKVGPEERHHLYISEAELQMHQDWVPLWAKSEIYFQSMVIDGVQIGDRTTSGGGEIDIERIPTRMIEARSKDLVPVFDYLQGTKFGHARVSNLDNNINGQLVHQRIGSWRGSSGSLDSMINGDCAAVGELHRGNEETGWTDTARGFVNKNDYPDHEMKSRLEIVNNRDSLHMEEAQIMFVNNNRDDLQMKTQFEGDSDELD